MLVFGGYNEQGSLGDLWQFDLTRREWTNIVITDGPSPRFTPISTLDAARDRLLVHGGVTTIADDELFALNLADHRWRRLPKGPSPRFDAVAASDGAHLYVFGGFLAGFNAVGDLWSFDLARDEWRLIEPRTHPRPDATTNAALAVHGGFLYLTGGHDLTRLTPSTWRFDLRTETWERLDEVGELPVRTHFAYVRDPTTGALWLAGGDNSDARDSALLGRLFLGAPARFEELATSEGFPVRRHASLVLDPTRRELILFGGSRGSPPIPYDDTWILTLPRR